MTHPAPTHSESITAALLWKEEFHQRQVWVKKVLLGFKQFACSRIAIFKHVVGGFLPTGLCCRRNTSGVQSDISGKY
jgi:hypothetical protein